MFERAGERPAAFRLAGDSSRSILANPMTDAFDRVRFVLVAPSHPGNIGAAARALKTMGFARLVVVRPRHADFRDHADAVALSTGALDVLRSSASFDTLAAALADVRTAWAMTGYDREFGPPLDDLRSCADAAARRAGEGEEVAFVFGTERSGLQNDDVARCQACCAIPANPAFSSLNLAQAVQVAAYECQLALRGSVGVQGGQRRFGAEEPPAAGEALEGFYAHFERALVTVGALDPDEPKRLMPRLRRLLNRARPTQTEIDLLRGVTAAIIESRADRAGRKRGR
jgi:tRNA/rRNA methyltransferase